MERILNVSTKFITLGPVTDHDDTAKIEKRIQRRLLELKKNNTLTSSVYERIRPHGAQRPQMYGLPKTHKEGVPLRPILSMI